MDEGTRKTPNPKCRLYWCLIEFIDWRYLWIDVFIVPSSMDEQLSFRSLAAESIERFVEGQVSCCRKIRLHALAPSPLSRLFSRL
jgi:hypothetical protein